MQHAENWEMLAKLYLDKFKEGNYCEVEPLMQG
jgi:hypothetical protein